MTRTLGSAAWAEVVPRATVATAAANSPTSQTRVNKVFIMFRQIAQLQRGCHYTSLSSVCERNSLASESGKRLITVFLAKRNQGAPCPLRKAAHTLVRTALAVNGGE